MSEEQLRAEIEALTKDLTEARDNASELGLIITEQDAEIKRLRAQLAAVLADAARLATALDHYLHGVGGVHKLQERYDAAVDALAAHEKATQS